MLLKFKFSAQLYKCCNCLLFSLHRLDMIPTEKVEKASKWAVCVLVDLRVVFIITYVYISVVNLISTTANGEATADTNSMDFFDVTSKPEHINVSISFIDDAVLWNCREHSETKKYYRGLYWMLIAAFNATLIVFTATKLAILCGSKHGRLSLWQIAVVRTFQEQVEYLSTSTKYCKEEANDRADCYKNLLTTKYYKKHEEDLHDNFKNSFSVLSCFRMTSLSISVVCLSFGMLLSFLAYDLHPLSCVLFIPSEDSISYNATTEAVHINFPESILIIQKVIAAIIITLGLFLAVNVIFFFSCTYGIIYTYKKIVPRKLQALIDAKQLKKTAAE